jgi:O-antigen/teichoic acid export membrane protein
VIDQAVASATSFLTGWVIARAAFDAKAEFGVWYLAWTLVLFARGLQSPLICGPYMIFCHRRRGRELAEYTGSTLVHQLALSALALAAVLGLAASIGLGLGPRNLLPAVGGLTVAMPILLLREFGRNQVLSELKPFRAIVLDGTVAIVQLGLLGLIWGVGLLSAGSAYFIMAAAAAVGCCQWLWLARGQWRIVRARILADWRENWRLARWALASYLVGCTAPYIMPWIVAVANSQADAGLLGACGTLAGVASLFVMGLANFLTPSIARAYARSGKAAMCRVVARGVSTFGILVGGIALASLVAGEFFVVRIYGPQFARQLGHYGGQWSVGHRPAP